MRNHAEAIVACDFFAVVTASFKVLYVFIVVEHATRRIIHLNVTAHPSSDWTLQQLREAIPGDRSYRFLVRDRDRKFGDELDRSVRCLGLTLMLGGRTVHWDLAYQNHLRISRCPCRNNAIGYRKGITLLAAPYWAGYIMNMR